MDKVVFQAPQNGEAVEFYVVEQTKINGIDYLLVTEEEDGDCDAYILKEVLQEENDEVTYELVESEEELEYMSRMLDHILKEVDFIM